MNKIELLLEKFDICLDDGLENAKDVISASLKDKLDENKMNELLKYVEEYYKLHVKEDEELNTDDSISTTIEDSIPTQNIESEIESTEAEAIKQQEILEVDSQEEALKKDENIPKGLDDIYRSYDNGNRLNKIWFSLSVVLPILLYFLIDNINLAIRRSGKINIILQILIIIISVFSLLAYYLDRKNFEYRKNTIARYLFLITNLFTLLGIVFTYTLDKFESNIIFNSFTMGRVFLQISLMISFATMFTLYLASHKKLEIRIKTSPTGKEEINSNE